VRGLARETFQAAVGQLERISKVSYFASWANTSIFIGKTVPQGRLVQQFNVRLMGQCGIIA